jgi:hypothetical protein
LKDLPSFAVGTPSSGGRKTQFGRCGRQTDWAGSERTDRQKNGAGERTDGQTKRGLKQVVYHTVKSFFSC